MRCYFKLVGSDQIITDEEGLEVADVEEARTLADEAIRDAPGGGRRDRTLAGMSIGGPGRFGNGPIHDGL
jgi:uncharacterized protein DUF6894